MKFVFQMRNIISRLDKDMLLYKICAIVRWKLSGEILSLRLQFLLVKVTNNLRVIISLRISYLFDNVKYRNIFY